MADEEGSAIVAVGSEATLQCEAGFIMRSGGQCLREQTVVCASTGRVALPRWISKNFASSGLNHCQRGEFNCPDKV